MSTESFVFSAIGCIGMLLSRSMLQLTVSYSVMMLGASFAWGGILALVPQFVPKQQHGAVSGWVGLMSKYTRKPPPLPVVYGSCF